MKKLISALFVLTIVMGVGPVYAQFINELQASTAGSDWEFVEIYTATPSTDITGLTVIVLEGDVASATGTVDGVHTFAGSTDANGLRVASNSAADSAYGIAGDEVLSFAPENGSETFLLVTGWTGSVGTDLDTNDDGTLDSTPWTALLDSVAMVDADAGDIVYSSTVLGPDGTYFPSGIFRSPDGGSWSATFLNFSTPDGTPGSPNTVPVELQSFSIE